MTLIKEKWSGKRLKSGLKGPVFGPKMQRITPFCATDEAPSQRG